MVVAGYLVEAVSVSVTLLIIAICDLLVTVIQAFNPVLRQMERAA